MANDKFNYKHNITLGWHMSLLIISMIQTGKMIETATKE